MRKLFGANKKKKSSSKLKAGTLKIPIPMINGVEYADLTESQISTLIGGGNRDYHKKKLASSLSSQRTNNTTQTEKTPSNIPMQQPPVVTPSRSISSPPILVMPKPMHSLPPTRYLLRNYDYEKTQVESSSDGNSSSDSSEEEEEEEQEEEEEHRIMSSPLPLKTEREDEESRNHQSYSFVTRTSEDSIRQYVSASESPFPTASSIVSSMNQQPNVATLSPSFSSPSSPVKYTSIGNDMIHTNEPKRTTSSVPPPASSTFAAVSPVAAANETNVHDTQRTPKPPSSNSNEAVIQEFPLPPSNLYTTAAEDTQGHSVPSIHEFKSTTTTPPTKKRVSRPPTSSSGSSATVGHDVTHSQNRLVNNNSDKPPGSLLQTISSESPAFHQNNNNSRMDSLTEMLQSEIKKMALNADLLELKRTVDRMQQQRVADLEDHLTRVAEQKLREMEILEQIKQTKQRLDMAIAEKMFANNSNSQEQQNVPKQPSDDPVPVMKSSNSTNTTRSNKLRTSSGSASASNAHMRQQHPQQPATNKQRNRRSLPSAYQRLPAQNEYFPDMHKPNFEFDYPPPPPQFGYPQDYDPELDMMRMMNGNQQTQFVDPFAMDSPRGRYTTHRKSSLQRRPRSKSMESQWQEHLDQDPHYMQQHQQQHPHPPYPDMYPDGNFYYATPRTRSRKSSLRSAKSSSSDSDNNNNNNKNDNFDQASANTSHAEESAMDKKPASARQQDMGSDEDRHHATRHRSGSGRFRRGHPHPGAMGNIPPNMFGYPNGLPPLPHLMDRERMKMRPPPPPPPYGYPPPPGNEYFSYMPPSQRISPRMMAALAADEQNQQQQQQQQPPYGGYQWGPPPPPPQGMYGMPPPDNPGAAVNIPCDPPADQQAFGNRRFPPPPPAASGGQQQPNSLQQTPQPPPPPPPQGYISMYGERIYM